ncbi:MAG: amidohydrolase family protein [Gammaproteobacteria bacterium]
MSGTGEPPTVDSHVHIFTQDMPLAKHAWTRPTYSFTAEDLLATLDTHGVRFAVVAGISLYGYYNDYMLAKLREYPRLRGTVNVPATITLAELQTMQAAGAVGVRLFLSSQLSGEVADLRSADYQRLLKHVRDLDWHVHFLADENVFAAALDVLRASGVKVVIDHFSNPDPGQGPGCARVAAALKAIDAGNTWLKISAGFRFSPRSPPRSAEDYARARNTEAEFDRYLLERISPDRLLWGSDCPFIGHEGAVAYQDTLDAFAAAVPDVRTRHAISATALDFYFPEERHP